jgi:hypothetical protein
MPPPYRRLFIERTADGNTRFIEQVRIDHRRRDIFVFRGVLTQFEYHSDEATAALEGNMCNSALQITY